MEGVQSPRTISPLHCLDRKKNQPIKMVDIVSSHLKCQTANTTHLKILDLEHKLKNDGDYDIGGTYTDNRPDFWFIFRTHTYIRGHALVTLYVCNRQPASFMLAVGSENYMKHDKNVVYLDFEDNIDYHVFNNVKADSFSFVKTFNIVKSTDWKGKDVLIAIKIMNNNEKLNSLITDDIKLMHSFRCLLKDSEYSDVTVESVDGHRFAAHKFILASNSPVLREIAKSSLSHIKLDEVKVDVQHLLEFLYTGEITDLESIDSSKLLEIAMKYEVNGLAQLSQHSMLKTITTENALEVAKLAHKHKLILLKASVFQYIDENKAIIFNSPEWQVFTDIDLIKELTEHVYSNN